MSWREHPAFGGGKPTDETDKTSRLLRIWEKYRDRCKEWGVPDSESWDIAKRVLGEWKQAIDTGTGGEWAKLNHDRFEQAMAGCGVAMDFTRIGDVELTGRDLYDAVRKDMKAVPGWSVAHKEVMERGLPPVRNMKAVQSEETGVGSADPENPAK